MAQGETVLLVVPVAIGYIGDMLFAVKSGAVWRFKPANRVKPTQ